MPRFLQTRRGRKPAIQPEPVWRRARRPIKKDKLFFFADYRRLPPRFPSDPIRHPAHHGHGPGRFQRALKRPSPIPFDGTQLSQRHHSAIRLYSAGQRCTLPRFRLRISPEIPITSNRSPADTVSNDKGDFRGDYYLSRAFDILRPLQPGRPSDLQPRQHSQSGQHQQQQRQRLRPQQAGRARATWTVNPTSVFEARLGRRLHRCRQNSAHAGLGHPAILYPQPATSTPALAGGLFCVGS